jgi:hypothetical protein
MVTASVSEIGPDGNRLTLTEGDLAAAVFARETLKR